MYRDNYLVGKGRSVGGLKQLLALRSTLCGTGLPLCEATAYGQALPSLAQALVQLRGVKKQANEVGAASQA